MENKRITIYGGIIDEDENRAKANLQDTFRNAQKIKMEFANAA